MRPTSPACLLVVVAVLACAGGARTQCSLTAVPTGSGLPGVNLLVQAMARWDPDGAGPAPDRLVVTGLFTVAAASVVDRLAVGPRPPPRDARVESGSRCTRARDRGHVGHDHLASIPRDRSLVGR